MSIFHSIGEAMTAGLARFWRWLDQPDPRVAINMAHAAAWIAKQRGMDRGDALFSAKMPEEYGENAYAAPGRPDTIVRQVPRGPFPPRPVDYLHPLDGEERHMTPTERIRQSIERQGIDPTWLRSDAEIEAMREDVARTSLIAQLRSYADLLERKGKGKVG